MVQILEEQEIIDDIQSSNMKDFKPLSEDNWEDELNSIPLFMQSMDDKSMTDNVAIDALRALAYDGDPDEIALNFKQQGNAIVKSRLKKNYPDAIQHYSKALAQPLDSDNNHAHLILKLQCLSNRAHVHLLLQNNRSANKDCLLAMGILLLNAEMAHEGDLHPIKRKLQYRLASSQLALKHFNECRTTIASSLNLSADQLLSMTDLSALRQQYGNNVDMLNLLEQLISAEKTLKINEEKKNAALNAHQQEIKKLRQKLANMNIKTAANLIPRIVSTEYRADGLDFSPSQIFRLGPSDCVYSPQVAPPNSIHQLEMPAVVWYARYREWDEIPAWEDTASFTDLFNAMSQVNPDRWDTSNNAGVNDVAVYIPVPKIMSTNDDKINFKWRRVNVLQTLGQLMVAPDFVLAEDGVIRIFIAPKPDDPSESAKWTRNWLKSGQI